MYILTNGSSTNYLKKIRNSATEGWPKIYDQETYTIWTESNYYNLREKNFPIKCWLWV